MAMLLQRPELVGAAVLFAAMVPFLEPPEADLRGKAVVVSNGAPDPMIPGQVLPQISRLIAGFARDNRLGA
jgi:phospholipase/carboxylesterase